MFEMDKHRAGGLLLTGAGLTLDEEEDGERFSLRLGALVLASALGHRQGQVWRAQALRVSPEWRALGVEELLLLRLGERLWRGSALQLVHSVAPTRLAELVRMLPGALAGHCEQMSAETAAALLRITGRGAGRSPARLAMGALALRRWPPGQVPEVWCPEAERLQRLGFTPDGAELSSEEGPRSALGVALRFAWTARSRLSAQVGEEVEDARWRLGSG